MARQFYYDGHHFKVVPVEGSNDEIVIIMDGRKTKRTNVCVASLPPQDISNLFKG